MLPTILYTARVDFSQFLRKEVRVIRNRTFWSVTEAVVLVAFWPTFIAALMYGLHAEERKNVSSSSAVSAPAETVDIDPPVRR